MCLQYKISMTSLLSFMWSMFGTPNDEIETGKGRYPYKRINHFKQYLNRFQGINGEPIPDNVIQCIAKECSKECSKMKLKDDRDTLTYQVVKRMLKQNGYSKYYDFINDIIRQLGGRVANFTPEEVNKLSDDFEKLSLAFDALVPEFEGRTGFLNYGYVVCKLCDRNGITVPICVRNNMVPKRIEKMMNNEKICKRLYEYNGWNFIPWEI